jgi:hypothetical protein
MRFGRRKSTEDSLQKLARKIAATAKQDEERLGWAREIGRRRAVAALELHTTCAAFVDSVNRLLPRPMLELSPPAYSADAFRDPGSNVFQINVSGRIVHIEFQAADTPTSVEKFRIPYILEGSLRAFNQELLDMSVIPEQLVFCCLERNSLSWLCCNPRTQQAAPLDQKHLITVLDRLV